MGDVRPKKLCELPNPPFTNRTILIVWQTLDELPDQGELTRVFYKELFRMRPDARSLFPDDMSKQEEVFLSGIILAIDHMGEPAKVEKSLRKWGVIHRRDKQIADELYVYVGHALVRAVQQLTHYVGTCVGSSWVALYEWMAAVMIDGADRYDRTMEEAKARYRTDMHSDLQGRHR